MNKGWKEIMTKKKGMVILGIIFLTVICIVGGYFIYLFATYTRIEDKVQLEIRQADGADDAILPTGETVTLMSFNVGFGAYTADYSFFMDGGEYSRAYDKETVIDNIEKDIAVIEEYNPDVVLLQEVDEDSTRSYHVNEVEMFQNAFGEYTSNYAKNYHSAYLFFPVTNPHGKSNSGLLTLSKYKMNEAERRSLPISSSVYKFMDLDRCYAETRIPTDNGKELILYHVHLSAYTREDDIVSRQIAMLSEDMAEEYQAGNYVICGGDFNQDMLGNSPQIFGTDTVTQSWAADFPEELLPEGIKTMAQHLTTEQIYALAPSCRNADSPYKEGESFVTYVDGFLISDNVDLVKFETIKRDFETSDHNPIRMEVVLR